MPHMHQPESGSCGDARQGARPACVRACWRGRTKRAAAEEAEQGAVLHNVETAEAVGPHTLP